MAAKRWGSLEKKYFTKEEVDEMGREAHEEVRRVRLQELRVLLNRRQVDVARKTGRTQESLSNLENRSDIKWSTLLDYVTKGLGGTIKVIVEVDGQRFELMIGEAVKNPRKRSEEEAA